MILKIISQYDFKHIMMLQIKNNNVNVFAYIITVHPICLTIIHYHSSSYLSHYHTLSQFILSVSLSYIITLSASLSYIITVHPICLTIIHYHSSSYLSHYHTLSQFTLSVSLSYIITVHPICLTIIHYHSSSYLSHYHTNDNVCLNLLKCCYFIYIVEHGFNDRLNTSTQTKSPNSKWLITSCCIEYTFYCDQPRLYK